jgi:hypothetical protein
MQDPSSLDMYTELCRFSATEFTVFDRAEAIYWFANYHHSGQSSQWYAVLCNSGFQPSPLANGPRGSAKILYDHLVQVYTGETNNG